VIVWRISKARYDPWDASGAEWYGGRWNSPGAAVLYTADTYAGAILEILVHQTEPRSLPGPHRAMRADVPDDLVEAVSEEDAPGWDQRDYAAARAAGDRWLAEARTAALVVPALPCRPVGRIVVINLAHPDAARIVRGAPFAVPWDERLF
jgi:RES domain-containing protein